MTSLLVVRLNLLTDRNKATTGTRTQSFPFQPVTGDLHHLEMAWLLATARQRIAVVSNFCRHVHASPPALLKSTAIIII